VTRNVSGSSYTLGYDTENHLTGMTGGSVNASFLYDGDGNRVQGIVGGVTTAYICSHFEWIGPSGTMKKYYYAGGVRVAMREGSNDPLLLLGYHLGSTSKVANFDGQSVHSQQLYKPWGEKRYPTGAPTLPTIFRYTGQHRSVTLSYTGMVPGGTTARRGVPTFRTLLGFANCPRSQKKLAMVRTKYALAQPNLPTN